MNTHMHSIRVDLTVCVFGRADEELLCRSVWSERSGVRSADRAISRCRVGEEMMSCSSYAPDGVHAGGSIAVSSQPHHKTPSVEGVALKTASLCVSRRTAGRCSASPTMGRGGRACTPWRVAA